MAWRLRIKHGGDGLCNIPAAPKSFAADDEGFITFKLFGRVADSEQRKAAFRIFVCVFVRALRAGLED